MLVPVCNGIHGNVISIDLSANALVEVSDSPNAPADQKSFLPHSRGMRWRCADARGCGGRSYRRR